jgi:hypothetical protein
MNTFTKRWTYLAVDTAHLLEVILHQVLQADGCEEVILPAFDATIHPDGHVALFADCAAERPCFLSGCDVRQCISEIIKFAAFEYLRWHVVFEPENFRYFHFDGHLPHYRQFSNDNLVGCSRKNIPGLQHI